MRTKFEITNEGKHVRTVLAKSATEAAQMFGARMVQSCPGWARLEIGLKARGVTVAYDMEWKTP